MLLLHISDIHFRKSEFGSRLDLNAPLRSALVRDAKAQCDRLDKSVDAILISGDLTFAGDHDEFRFAQEWLESLCAACRTNLSSIFVVPGNHDVVQSIASRPTINALHQSIKNGKTDVELDAIIAGYLKDADAGRLLYTALEEYNNFASQFFCDLLPPERTVASRDLNLNDGSILRLSGLNSSFVSGKADNKGDLFVDRSYLAIERTPGVEHLVICHHPPPWLRQGQALLDHLNDVSRLQLFGHEHTNRIDTNRDFVRVFADASHPERVNPGWEPGYNFIELSVSGDPTSRVLNISVHVRVWQKAPPQFCAKLDRDGTDSFRQTIRLDAWEPPTVAEPTAPPIQDRLIEVAAADDGLGSVGADMSNIRDISIRFFKLTLSQKAAIAGTLNLLEDQDISQPDFERFRRVFKRAKERGLIERLDCEIASVKEAD